MNNPEHHSSKCADDLAAQLCEPGPTRTPLSSNSLFVLYHRLMSPFAVFEHTADVGLRIEADSLEELFVEAARGLFALVLENPAAIERREELTIELEAEDRAGLFVDWLRELIFRFETEHLLVAEFAVELFDDDRRLRAHCRGEPADWSRHLPGNELKAVTYHGLRVEQTAKGWEAEVIFDI